jgi:hypothetical protein
VPRPSRHRPPPPRPFYAAGFSLVVCAALLFGRAFWYSRDLLVEYLYALWIEHSGWYSIALIAGAITLVWASYQIERRIPK